jgi:ABC-type lipoprotein export system ATPase subunit
MNIDDHVNILINEYNLDIYYKKFLIFSILTSCTRESFYWLLIYFSENVKLYPDLLLTYSGILIGLLIIHIPLERYLNNTKAEFSKELKTANTKYFFNRIIDINKKDILNFDLVEFNNVIEHFNDYFDQYIDNIKIKYDIPLRFISLIVIALNKKFNLLIGLFFIYYAIIKVLNEWKNIDESQLNNKVFSYENTIRNYIISSKNLLVNNELNTNYLNKNIHGLQDINFNINELNNNLDMKVNIFMICYILIVLYHKIDHLNINEFFYYFIIVYDIEFIGDKLAQFYKNQINYNKMQKRLKYLYSYEPNKIIVNEQKIDTIIIKKIINDKPKINLKNIILKNNDHILINGVSGSGKTSLLYVLKGIINPEILEINYDINLINKLSYLTLANHKNLFNGNLYDIISNYDEIPNEDLINKAIILSKFTNNNDNNYIEIETLSSGERIRLLVCKIIYNVIKDNYNILLFDEIDENLNDQLAIDICNNIRSIFKDKIILYITHNEKVKNLFDKKILIKNGSNL